MISLANYIYEAKEPTFTKDLEGITAFCEYVFDEQFTKWVVNPDLSITLTPAGRSNIMYMDTKELKEIPDFIVFSGVENVKIGCGIGSDCKVNVWKPRVNGYCQGIVLQGRPKATELDLSECEIRGGILCIEDTGIKSIVGAHGEGVQVYIMKNKKLESVDLKNISSCTNGSWLSKNKKLEVKPSDLPKGIRVEKNAQNKKIYIS